MGSESVRPLTIYFLLDTSASMHGAALQAAQDALESIAHSLTRALPPSIPRRWNVLLYHSTLIEVQRHEPTIHAGISSMCHAGGTSNLGKAWRQISEWQREENTFGLCFVLTDGQPTDDFARAGEAFPHASVVMIGIGCGRTADLSLIAPYLDAAFLWHELNADAFFRFLSDTCIQQAKENSDARTVR